MWADRFIDFFTDGIGGGIIALIILCVIVHLIYKGIKKLFNKNK